MEPCTYKDIPVAEYMDYEAVYDRIAANLQDHDTFVELGVLFGRSMAYMASLTKGRPITLVGFDLFDGDVCGYADRKGDFMPETMRNLAAVGADAAIMKIDTIKAASGYQNESVAAVWVDSDHAYKHVLNELIAWWPKIKPGGILAGHDYDLVNHMEVVRAVQDFANVRGLKYEINHRSFILVKNEINAFFEKTYCLNLAHRTDRRKFAQEQHDKLGLNAEFFNAAVGKYMPPQGELSRGHIGCRVSHCMLMDAVELGEAESVLILEDDIEFAPNANQRFQDALAHLPDDWDVILVGGTHIVAPEAIESNLFWMRCVESKSTAFYGIRKHMAPIIRAAILEEGTYVDVCIASLQKDYKFYTLHPPLAWQAPGYSDIEEGNVDYTEFQKPGTFFSTDK